VEALRAQRDQQTLDRKGVTAIDGLVFTSPTGRPLHETNTLKALYEALAATDLPRVTQHDLRHSCATLLYSMGVPLETIADILGHSSSRITADLYRHRVQELQSAAAAKMQEALG
jgi:integrase